MTLDWKNLRLGIWLGAGIALFTAMLGVLRWLIDQVRSHGG